MKYFITEGNKDVRVLVEEIPNNVTMAYVRPLNNFKNSDPKKMLTSDIYVIEDVDECPIKNIKRNLNL